MPETATPEEMSADQLRAAIAKALNGMIFWRRITLAAAGLVLVALVVLASLILRTTRDTNDAVAGQITVLQERNDQLEAMIADLESVNVQAIDWIQRLAEQIVDLGGTPPEIVIRPPEDPEQETP